MYLPPSLQHESSISETEPDLPQPDSCSAGEDSWSSIHDEGGAVDEESSQDNHPEECWTCCPHNLGT